LKIAMISGNPDIACGVADYTQHLVAELSHAGVVHSPAPENWGLRSSASILREVRQQGVDLVHVQYPAADFGFGLAPQGVAFLTRIFAVPLVVTIHEFSLTHSLRKLASSLFSHADALVFTNSFELEHFSRVAPWVRNRVFVVPVGSGVPFLTAEHQDDFEVVYFGLIRPNKGIEMFLDLAALSLANHLSYRFVLIGSPQVREQEYFRSISQRMAALSNVVLETNLAAVAVAQRVARAGFAYLPFPDGASERRTSLIAMMGNGLTVLTTQGAHTPKELTGAVVFVENERQALEQLKALTNASQARARLKANALEYVQRFQWSSIAQKHVEIYRRLLKK
jgi:glycosyltransferase involved in cell wall biosynthesis